MLMGPMARAAELTGRRLLGAGSGQVLQRAFWAEAPRVSLDGRPLCIPASKPIRPIHHFLSPLNTACGPQTQLFPAHGPPNLAGQLWLLCADSTLELRDCCVFLAREVSHGWWGPRLLSGTPSLGSGHRDKQRTCLGPRWPSW